MPNSEAVAGPWTQGELVRTVARVVSTLERIETKLDQRPDWDDINRLTASRDDQFKAAQSAQATRDATQDVAIKAIEERMSAAFRLSWTSLSGALVAGGGWVLTLLTR